MNVLSFESICVFLLSQGEILCILFMDDYLLDPTALLVLGIQQIHVDQEMIGKIAAAGQLMQCSASLDVLFLLDGSYSIGKGSFERSKHFAGKLCDALDIHPDRVRVGMIQFSSTPHLEFPLDSYLTKQEVKERIKRTVFRLGCLPMTQEMEPEVQRRAVLRASQNPNFPSQRYTFGSTKDLTITPK